MPKAFDPEKAFGGTDEEQSYLLWRDTWLNEGFNEVTQSHVEFNDLIATPNAAYWMPKIVEEIIREPVEPLIMIPSLLDRISFNPAARITFPAIGALTAAEIGESQAFPEQILQIAPGTITINIGKHGLAIKISEEMRKYSQYDLINMHLRAGALALARHKEKLGMEFITAMGVRLFDNKNPTTSVFGTCTGRSISGSGNGSCRMEDLLKAYSHIMMQGYTPNAILIHPLAWSMWMADPMLRTIVKNTGNGAWFQRHNMAKSLVSWSAANQSKMGRSGGFTSTPSGNAASATPDGAADVDQTLKSAAVIPDYFPYPLNVLVSPFVPYNATNNTCDIMIFDSRNLGALVVDEDVSMDQWTDMSTDILKIKLKERYAFAIYEDGLAIGVLKNIPIKANEIALPVQPTISSAGSVVELDVTTPISGL